MPYFPYCENCGSTDRTVKACDSHSEVGCIYLCQACRVKLDVPPEDIIDE